VVLSGAVHVLGGQEVGEVVVLRGSVLVEGVVHGDVVMVSGKVVVLGQVGGSVIVVDGSADLGRDAQVGGDVIASGDVNVGEGAKVGGRIRGHAAFTLRGPLRAVGRFLPWLAVSVSSLLLALLLILVAPRGADAVFDAARTAPWSSLGWGLGLFLGVPAVSVAAIATLVGLPLGLVVVLALAFVFSLGYACSAWVIGRLLWRPWRSRALAVLFGWMILRAIALIPYAGGATWVAGAAYGLGTMSVATWRARAVGGKHREGRAQPMAQSEQMKEEMGL
jgi:hypothetical protein